MATYTNVTKFTLSVVDSNNSSLTILPGNDFYSEFETASITNLVSKGYLRGTTLEYKVDPISKKIEILNPSTGKPLSITNKQWRGVNQGMSVDIQGYGGGGAYSMTHRTRHYLNVRFRRVRAVLQCFHTIGSPLVDTNFTNDYNFQVGLEPVFKNATTGLTTPRKMFKFNSSETAQYRQATPPSNGYIISDTLDLGEYVEAQQFFGLWTTVEEATAGTPVTGRIPYTRSASNYLNRYIGAISANGTTLAQSQIALDSARSATSITPATSAQAGGSNYFTPIMLLIETDSDLPFIWHVSDSIGYGVGEGVAGSGMEGDGVGSALGNRGFIERAIYENLGYNGGGFGRGSDGNKYLSTPSNWVYRRALLQLANPTHVINANVHNDFISITIANWAVSTAYAKWDCKLANGNIYTCVVAGTSSASVGGPSGTGGGIVDGTCIWAYIMPQGGSSIPRGAAQVLAQMANVNEQIKTILPNIPIIAMTVTSDAASTDSWATAVNQTPATVSGWGDLTSRRHIVNTEIRDKNPLLKIDGYFDPAIFLEDSYPTETSKWISNGTASYVTNDGTHPNSVGYRIGSYAITADIFEPI